MSWTADPTARAAPRFDPAVAWTVVTDAPLKFMALAREALRILLCDDAGQLYLVDSTGEFLAVTRAPGRVVAGAISDDGSLVALLGEGNRLWILSSELELIDDRQAVMEAVAIAVDPLGNYIAVSSKLNLVQLYNKFGKQAGRFEVRQHLSHMAFVPATPTILGVGAFGSISSYDVVAASSGKLGGELGWTEQLMSGVGRLAVTGDGGVILLGCYSLGVQRFDSQGNNEGAYHLGGSAMLASVDIGGRTIAVATQEGELAILNGGGNVRWRTNLPRPALGLEVDALGRFLVYGLASGEVTRIDFQGGSRKAGARSTPAPAAKVSARPGSGPVRAPDWMVEVAQTDDQAEFVVLAVVEDPPMIGVITHKNKLDIYTPSGKKLGQAPEILGVGRIIRSSSGWIAAATDRQIVVCNLATRSAHRVDVSLVEVTHLAIKPESFGLLVVQERDRVGRLTLAGRWIWKTELDGPVEDVGIGLEGDSALSLEDGRLLAYNPAGVLAGSYQANPPEPLLLLPAPAGSPPNVAWITLARRDQVLRGHDRSARPVWESPIPWDGWGLHAAGAFVVATASDGRAVAFDGKGYPRGASGKSENSLDLFTTGDAGQPIRIAKQGVHLIGSQLDGQVTWRAVADQPIGPIAAGGPGIAVMIGKSLAWFGQRDAHA